MKVSTMKLHVSQLFSSVKRNLQAFNTPSQPLEPTPGTAEDRSRYFTVIIEVVNQEVVNQEVANQEVANQEVVDQQEANIRLLESTARLTDALHLPDGCHIRSSFEISADTARVVINM